MPGRVVDPRFPQRMRDLMQRRGISYRQLAALAYQAKSHLQAIGTGAKPPTAEVAARIDDALQAGGELAGYVYGPDVADDARRDSARLVELVGAGDLTQVAEATAAGVVHLAVDYLSTPAATMVGRAVDLRRTAVDALRLPHAGRGTDGADLLVAIGRASGVLAYAAVDLGDAPGALVHAEAAWQCAEAAGHNGLRAWVRGTQSLIHRFAGDYRLALELADDGRQYAATGPAEARLLCGVAQSHANMGDAAPARRALDVAADVHAAGNGAEDPGLFGFSPAKLAYYSGSSLIWLENPADARRARVDSVRAIALWRAGPAGERSLDDEALAHVYLATADLQLHQLEAASAALAPILDLSDSRKISWIAKRLERIVELLEGQPYRHDRLAAETVERIRAY